MKFLLAISTLLAASLASAQQDPPRRLMMAMMHHGQGKGGSYKDPSMPEYTTMTIEELGSTDTILYWSNDETKPGIGDKYIWNNESSMGSIKGSCDASQTVSGDFEWVCSGWYALEDGALFFQGSLPRDENDSVTWGITGGNGKYYNVAGTSTVSFPVSDGISGVWTHEVKIHFN